VPECVRVRARVHLFALHCARYSPTASLSWHASLCLSLSRSLSLSLHLSPPPTPPPPPSLPHFPLAPRHQRTDKRQEGRRRQKEQSRKFTGPGLLGISQSGARLVRGCSTLKLNHSQDTTLNHSISQSGGCMGVGCDRRRERERKGGGGGERERERERQRSFIDNQEEVTLGRQVQRLVG
jgi:hypothetical protein